jgi:zinc/manganese transport system permease protein
MSGLAGALLATFPAMDHPWLDAIERAAPSIQEAFLTPTERGVRRDSLAAIALGEGQLRQARALLQDAEWGARAVDDAGRERLRQFVAGRSELGAGDRMVLGTLRGKARQRQRYWLGLPLLTLGSVTAIGAARRLPARPRTRAGYLAS